MNVVIAGGSGFIGRALVRALLARGDDVAVLSRDPAKVREGRGVAWASVNDVMRDADAIVNLSGENVGAGRWTDARRERIVRSRVDTTRKLVEAMRAAPQRARTFVSASAVGYYGLHGDEVLDENAGSGGGFLADVTRQWEAAAREGEAFARLVILRFGVVLGGGKGGRGGGGGSAAGAPPRLGAPPGGGRGGALAKRWLPSRWGGGGGGGN